VLLKLLEWIGLMRYSLTRTISSLTKSRAGCWLTSQVLHPSRPPRPPLLALALALLPQDLLGAVPLGPVSPRKLTTMAGTGCSGVARIS
jgi:hypothetical protein